MPVSAFVGDDDLRRGEALESAAEAWQNKGGGGDCVREMHFGEDLDPVKIVEAYEAADLFAPRKVLIIRNYDKVSAANREHIEKTLARDNPQTAVFLEARKLEATSALAKRLKSADALATFKLPYENQIPQWLADRAKTRFNRRLGPSEARFLQEVVGNDLMELDHELEKMDTFLKRGEPITHEAIEDLASPMKVFIFFEFQKAMGLRDKAHFVPALRNLIEHGNEGFLIAMRLFSHCLKLARIRAALDRGMGESDIAETFKLNAFLHIKKERYLDQARSRPLSLWKRVLARLAQLEAEMKQGRYPNRFELELAFAGLL